MNFPIFLSSGRVIAINTQLLGMAFSSEALRSRQAATQRIKLHFHLGGQAVPLGGSDRRTVHTHSSLRDLR